MTTNDRGKERDTYWRTRAGLLPKRQRSQAVPEFTGWGTMTIEQRKEAARQYRRRMYAERNGREKSRAEARKRNCKALWPEPQRCEVCGNQPQPGKTLHLDHDHATSTFRGWLCRGCNHAIGHARDDSTVLRRLADYLDQRQPVGPS